MSTKQITNLKTNLNCDIDLAENSEKKKLK